jgi:hypothetical protein
MEVACSFLRTYFSSINGSMIEVVRLLGAGVGIGDCLCSLLDEVIGVGSVEVSGVGSGEVSGVGSAGAEIQEHRQFSRGFLFSCNFEGEGEGKGEGEGEGEGEAVGVGVSVGVGVGEGGGEGGGVMGLGRFTTIFLNFSLPDRFVRYVGYLLSFLVGNWQLMRSPNNISWHGISFSLPSLTCLRFFTKGKVS